MKKLMIAVAAAAMVGGAYAWTATYDFVANLRTTAGANGYVTYTAGNANLGVNDAGTTMWYNDKTTIVDTNGNTLQNTVINQGIAGSCNWASDAIAKRYPNLTWYKAYSVTGAEYPSLKITSAKGIINTAEALLLKNLEAAYPKDQAGYYCGIFQWVTETPGTCWRTHGADAIVQTVYVKNSCCTFMGFKGFDFAGGTRAINMGGAIGYDVGQYTDGSQYNPFLNRFGAQTHTDAVYTEAFAEVFPIETKLGYTFKGFLAGQGTYYKVSYFDDATAGQRIPVQMSGMIVGYTESPVCPDCCILPLPPAIAFDCSGALSGGFSTAAFGTFYINLKKLAK